MYRYFSSSHKGLLVCVPPARWRMVNRLSRTAPLLSAPLKLCCSAAPPFRSVAPSFRHVKPPSSATGQRARKTVSPPQGCQSLRGTGDAGQSEESIRLAAALLLAEGGRKSWRESFTPTFLALRVLSARESAVGEGRSGKSALLLLLLLLRWNFKFQMDEVVMKVCWINRWKPRFPLWVYSSGHHFSDLYLNHFKFIYLEKIWTC